MLHDPHTGFIVAAYVVAGTVIASMIVATLSDYRSLEQALRKFGPRGLDRE
jgi:hypothetical protein